MPLYRMNPIGSSVTFALEAPSLEAAHTQCAEWGTGPVNVRRIHGRSVRPGTLPGASSATHEPCESFWQRFARVVPAR
jgi:hypothetical protein